jgi:hypothetical protein
MYRVQEAAAAVDQFVEGPAPQDARPFVSDEKGFDYARIALEEKLDVAAELAAAPLNFAGFVAAKRLARRLMHLFKRKKSKGT